MRGVLIDAIKQRAACLFYAALQSGACAAGRMKRGGGWADVVQDVMLTNLELNTQLYFIGECNIRI